MKILALLLWANIAFGQAKPEAVDVPAIMERPIPHAEVTVSDVCPFPTNAQEFARCQAETVEMNKQIRENNAIVKSLTHQSCADKSRILMHSEDGQYWCHKPQTAPKPDCKVALIWPFDDQRDEAEMKVRICMTEER